MNTKRKWMWNLAMCLLLSLCSHAKPWSWDWKELDGANGDERWYNNSVHSMKVGGDDCFYAALASAMLSQGWPWGIYFSGYNNAGLGFIYEGEYIKGLVQTPCWDEYCHPYHFNLNMEEFYSATVQFGCLNSGNSCYGKPLSYSHREDYHTRTEGNTVNAEINRMALASQRAGYGHYHEEDENLLNVMRSKFGYADAILLNDPSYSDDYQEWLLRHYLDNGGQGRQFVPNGELQPSADNGQLIPGGDENYDGITIRGYEWNGAKDRYEYIVKPEYDQYAEKLPWGGLSGIRYGLGSLNPFFYGSSSGTVRRFYYGNSHMRGSGGGKHYWHRFMICNPLDMERVVYSYVSIDGIQEDFTSDYIAADDVLMTGWTQLIGVENSSYVDIDLKVYGGFGDVGVVPMDDRELDGTYFDE